MQIFSPYLRRWDLLVDGAAIITPSSRLLPVRWQGLPAMLKVALGAEEKFGSLLMAWWQGQGAAQVLACADNAILLERAECRFSLSDYARNGRDEDACRIICAVVAQLHAPRGVPLPELIPLSQWFRQLGPAAQAHGGIFSRCAAVAGKLLENPRDVGVLHGDIHHDNILDFGARGWLAIDPKRLLGERGFDYANLFCNPDLETAFSAERFRRRLDVVADVAGLERLRQLQWILAWCGLSAAWMLEDGVSAETVLNVAQLAAAELDRY